MSSFRLALSHNFRNPEGGPNFPELDFDRLDGEPGLEYAYLEPEPVYGAAQLGAFDAVILLSQQVARDSLPENRRLGLVARFGVGFDNVDLEAATEADIAVSITPEGVRRPVAVGIMTMMLALTARLFEKDRITRAGAWHLRTSFPAYGLVGRTLASIGLGRIGSEMFRMARPFDMLFIAYDPYADKDAAAALGVRLVDLETVFREADVLAVNCFLNDETSGIVNAERLALMKPTAFLVNTARGPVIDQAALTEALRGCKIAGAGLDVFTREPPDPDDPILALDNVIVTPHTLCSTDQMRRGCWDGAIDAVCAIKRGRAPEHVVNPAVLDRPGFRARLAALAERFAS